jgi:hypothetical protein
MANGDLKRTTGLRQKSGLVPALEGSSSGRHDKKKRTDQVVSRSHFDTVTFRIQVLKKQNVSV